MSKGEHTVQIRQQQAAQTRPGVSELFFASLVASALVYVAGALVFSGISFLGTRTGGFFAVLQSLVMFASVGLIAATMLVFLVVAPLGTALGLAMLKVSPPGWWQGPITGALVALTLEALVLVLFANEPLQPEWGNVATLAIPVALAMVAGAIVQQRVLCWPAGRPRG